LKLFWGGDFSAAVFFRPQLFPPSLAFVGGHDWWCGVVTKMPPFFGGMEEREWRVFSRVAK